MKVLAIETSCDETGIALLEGRHSGETMEFVTLKAELLSQAKLHAPFGGVFPALAKREHTKNLPVLFEPFKDDQFDAVVVTAGPGLEPALWTGIEFAKQVASERGVPVLPVNHMEGHIISSLAERHPDKLENVGMSVIKDVQFPVLALLISGGHTELVLTKDWFEYEMLGRTLDDAVGEAFDKVARMLELPYPGGPEISKLASKSRAEKATGKSLAESNEETRGLLNGGFSARLPRPMLNTNSCDMSFSGLKTAALYALKDKNLAAEEKAAFAAEFEDAVAEVLCAKVRRALNESGAKTFVIGGGVAANRYIREELQKIILEEFSDVEFRLPHLSITGDNAVMIGEAALARLLLGHQTLDSARFDLAVEARGNLSLA